MGLFSTLNTAYSGLTAASLATEVTGQNISNANTEGYTRQRAVIVNAVPLDTNPGQLGTGAKVTQITRVYDAYSYESYRKASTNLAFSDFQKSTLEELSSNFPDIDNEGIMKDLSAYFDSWQALASTPTSGSAKISLAQTAQTLSESIQKTRDEVFNIQKSIDKQLQSMVDEVNLLGSKIGDVNKKISMVEANGTDHANDLRDERDRLEMALSELIGPTVNKNQITSDTVNDTNEPNYNNYVALVAGFNIIDGGNSHNIVMQTNASATGFSSLYFESQDHTLYNMSSGISGGKIGAILELRGKAIDPDTGIPDDGKIQKFIDQIDALASSLIENSNNIYAQSATKAMRSQAVDVKGSTVFAQSSLSVKDGSFDVALYDATGKEVGRRTITVDTQTMSIDDIMKQITAPKDDTKDNNSTNDIDDYLDAGYKYENGVGVSEFKIKTDKQSTGYTFALIDNGTNLPGALGLGRFFDGKNGQDIRLRSDLYTNPVDINAYSNPVNGNNAVANAMQQFQFNKFTISTRMGQTSEETISSYYRSMVSSIASDTAAAQQTNTTFTAIMTTAQQVFQSVTKVNLDEELTNLMRFQTGYSANSKVITTIDQMLNTLLGIKQ